MQRDLLQSLLDQAFLYDDPTAYQAGVHAAWRALGVDQRDAAADARTGDTLVSTGGPASATG